MSKNPTRNYVIQWLTAHGATAEQAAAVAAALTPGPSADATGAVYGDVVGALLGPLFVRGIHGFDLPEDDPANGEGPTFDTTSGQWAWSTPGASSTGMVPYYIEVGATFTVPIYKQALFTEPIEVDGALVVNGMLLGVD